MTKLPAWFNSSLAFRKAPRVVEILFNWDASLSSRTVHMFVPSFYRTQVHPRVLGRRRGVPRSDPISILNSGQACDSQRRRL